jgi:hypothetical protein
MYHIGSFYLVNSVEALLPVASPIASCVRLTSHPCTHFAHIVLATPCAFKSDRGLIQEHAQVLIRGSILERNPSSALQPFHNKSSGERYELGREPCPRWVGLKRIRRTSTLEEAHGSERGHHQILVREVGVEGPAQWECCRVGIEGVIDLGAILHRGVCESGDKLVNVTHALNWSKRLAVSVMERQEMMLTLIINNQRTLCGRTSRDRHSTRSSPTRPS